MAASVTTGFCNKYFFGNKMTNFMKPKQLIDIYQMSTGNAAKPNQKKTGLNFL